MDKVDKSVKGSSAATNKTAGQTKRAEGEKNTGLKFSAIVVAIVVAGFLYNSHSKKVDSLGPGRWNGEVSISDLSANSAAARDATGTAKADLGLTSLKQNLNDPIVKDIVAAAQGTMFSRIDPNAPEVIDRGNHYVHFDIISPSANKIDIAVSGPEDLNMGQAGQSCPTFVDSKTFEVSGNLTSEIHDFLLSVQSAERQRLQ